MTKEEFEQWKDNAVTKEVMEIMKKVRDDNHEGVIKCAVSGEYVTSTRLAGNVEAFDYLLNIQLEDAVHD